MKRLAVLASLVATGMAAAGLQAQGQPPFAGIAPASERVWRVYGAGGTTTVFVRADGVALVDTKLAGNGAAILAEVRKVTDKPVTLIVNTHSHGDHVGSNAEINARGAIEVVAHVNTARRMAAAENVGPATRQFDDRLTLGSGEDRIDLYWFGAGHTDGDAFVVIPAERVMAAGDIFQLMAMPRIDAGSGGSALALPVTLMQAQNSIRDVDTVIPGHDPETRTWAQFRAYVGFTRALADAARDTRRGGGTPEHALAALERSPELQPFLEGDGRTRAVNGLNAAFAELADR
jgi:glyoxylase-like metal-dependent hydrolase (beta-lactamase superfamily II)